MKISVIVPVYNVEKYLRACLDSLLVDVPDGVEIIIVDDGSTDESLKICKEYTHYPFIKLIQQENRGLSGARNTGIEEARGEWISFVDSDDMVREDYFTTLEKVIANDENVDVVIFKLKEFEDEAHAKEELKNGFKSKQYRLITKNEAMESLVGTTYLNMAQNKIYNKDLFTNITYPEGRIYEDVATTYRLYEQAKQIAIYDDELYLYRVRSGSLSHTAKNITAWYHGILSWQEQCSFFEKNYPELAPQVQERILQCAVRYLHIANKYGVQDFKQKRDVANIVLSTPIKLDFKSRYKSRLMIEAWLYAHWRWGFNFIGNNLLHI